MIFSFKRRQVNFLRSLVVYLVLFCFSLLSLIPAVSAQTQPPANNSQPIQFVQTVPPEQQTPVPPPDQHTVPTPTGSETGRVLFGPCDLDPTPTCNAVTGAVGDIGGKIFAALIGGLGSLLKKMVVQALKLVAEVLGFKFDLYATICNGLFNQVGDLLTDTTSTAGNSLADTSNNFNIFVALDAGINGIYTGATQTTSSGSLVNSFKSNVLGISTAHAQGLGTKDLGDIIQKVWERMEQLAIILMVIILVIIGFMIMIRRRLDPRTVVTATSALPKFAIALVLIVFSFALSGLFIDMIHVTVELVRNFFSGVLPTVTNDLPGGDLVWFPLFTAFSWGTAFNWQAVACGAIGQVFGPGSAFSFLIVMFIFEIIIRLMLFIVAIYLFWVLIKNFAYMVLFTIFSPLMFLLGAVPGFEAVTTNWFKRMFVNTIAFPLIMFLIYLAVLLITHATPGGDSITAPPPVETNVLNIGYFIGMGMIFFATKVPQFLEKLFKMDTFDIRGGVGPGVLAAPIAVPAAGFQAAGGVAKSYGNIRDAMGAYGRTKFWGHENVGKWGQKIGYESKFGPRPASGGSGGRGAGAGGGGTGAGGGGTGAGGGGGTGAGGGGTGAGGGGGTGAGGGGGTGAGGGGGAGAGGGGGAPPDPVDIAYAKFGMARGASRSDFNSRYKEYMNRYHPDKNPDDIPGATKKTADLNAAADTIRKHEGWV